MQLPRRDDCELRLAGSGDVPGLVDLALHGEVWPWYAGTQLSARQWVAEFARQARRNAAGSPCLWLLDVGARRGGFIALEDGETSFAVDAALHGQGLGTEMIRRLRALARRDLLLERLAACVQRGNVRAVRCLERQGFRFAGLSQRVFGPRSGSRTVLMFETRLNEEQAR